VNLKEVIKDTQRDMKVGKTSSSLTADIATSVFSSGCGMFQ